METPEYIEIKIGKKTYKFEVNVYELYNLLLYEASDIKSERKVKYYAKPNSNHDSNIRYLTNKIIQEVSFKTLDGSDLNSRGTMQITYDGIVIDGKLFGYNEIGELLSTYEGFKLDYVILSDGLEGQSKKRYLKHVDLSKENILHKLQTYINLNSDNGFISYKDVFRFSVSFAEVIDDLYVLKEYIDENEFKSLVHKIEKEILDLETDDDAFPRYEIELLHSTLENNIRYSKEIEDNFYEF